MAEYSMRVHETGVVIFYLPDQSQKVIDNWIEDLARLGQAWIAEEIALLLIDMRGMGIPSLYNATNLHRISRVTPAAARVRTAFIFDAGTATVLAEKYLSSLGPLLGEKKAFLDDDTALKWLVEVLL